jgi:6-phosphogluconolactonase
MKVDRFMQKSIQSLCRFLLAAMVLGCVSPSHCMAEVVDAWIGTGGGSGSKGIYHITLDVDSGKISNPEVAAEIDSPGFLAVHPTGRYLFAGARREGKGGVAGFRLRNRMNPKLVPINEQALAAGSSTCVAVDRTGSVLLSVQYGAGSLSTFPIGGDGTIGECNQTIMHKGKGSGVVGKRQEKPHPHWIGTGPKNRFVFVPDLGLDKVIIYELFPEAATVKDHGQTSLAGGAGPRHMKFHPDGKFAYVLNELALTITVFQYDAEDGELKEVQSIETLKSHEKEVDLNTASEIRIHPNGKFVYAANRGHDSISVFEVNPENGKLSFVENEAVRGSWPRNFNIDPTGHWMLVGGQHSNTISLFRIDQASGGLVFARQIVNCPQPICFVFTRRMRANQ